MAKTKFDIKTEATRPFYATVGATDLTLEVALQAATDLQERVKAFEPKKISAPSFDLKTFDLKDFDVKALNGKAQAYAKEAAKEAKQRQAKIESRVKNIRIDGLGAQAKLKEAQTGLEARSNELVSDAKSLPGKAQQALNDVVSEVGGTYADLVQRGEKAVELIRRGEYKIVAPTKKPAAKKPTSTSTSTTKSTAKKSTAKKSTAKKASTKKASAKKAAPAKKAATKSTAKKTTAKKSTTKKTSAKKAAPAKKAPAKKAAPASTAKQTAATQAPNTAESSATNE